MITRIKPIIKLWIKGCQNIIDISKIQHITTYYDEREYIKLYR